MNMSMATKSIAVRYALTRFQSFGRSESRYQRPFKFKWPLSHAYIKIGIIPSAKENISKNTILRLFLTHK